MSPEPPNLPSDDEITTITWGRLRMLFDAEAAVLLTLEPEVARLTAERDQLKADNQIKDAAVEGAIRRAERAEQRLDIATELIKAQAMEHYFK